MINDIDLLSKMSGEISLPTGGDHWIPTDSEITADASDVADFTAPSVLRHRYVDGILVNVHADVQHGARLFDGPPPTLR